jgi:protein-S-isoprenylcysteine O-methyltransferase Ste14
MKTRVGSSWGSRLAALAEWRVSQLEQAARLIVYGALLCLFFHVWVVAVEEPTLEQTFGTEYEAFRAAVPRWIPRMTPWRSK